jgi:hypothetical protein
MSHEDADAENGTRSRDYLGHPAKTAAISIAKHRSVNTELQSHRAKSLRDG